jgi:hypothetical protein
MPQQQQVDGASVQNGGDTISTSTISSATPATATAAGKGLGKGVGVGVGNRGWAENAVAMPGMDQGAGVVLQLELGQDIAAGSSLEVEVLYQWASRDGHRWQQVRLLT